MFFRYKDKQRETNEPPVWKEISSIFNWWRSRRPFLLRHLRPLVAKVRPALLLVGRFDTSPRETEEDQRCSTGETLVVDYNSRT